MAEKKEININQVLSYLTHAFNNAVQKAELGAKNTKGTKLHALQCDFAYLINDIQRGPKNFVPKKISDANELIDSIK